MTEVLTNMVRAETDLADVVSRACDARSRVAEAIMAWTCGDHDAEARRIASARKLLSRAQEAIKDAEMALTAASAKAAVTEAKTGGPNVRRVPMPPGSS